jgi:hypothetical protein
MTTTLESQRNSTKNPQNLRCFYHFMELPQRTRSPSHFLSQTARQSQNYLPTHANQHTKLFAAVPLLSSTSKFIDHFPTFPFSVPEVFTFVVFICYRIAKTPLTVMTEMKPAVVCALIVAVVTR